MKDYKSKEELSRDYEEVPAIKYLIDQATCDGCAFSGRISCYVGGKAPCNDTIFVKRSATYPPLDVMMERVLAKGIFVTAIQAAYDTIKGEYDD